MHVAQIKSVLRALVIAALAGDAGLTRPARAGEQPREMDRPIRSLVGHQDRVNSVAYSPDGRWIATAGSDGAARLWDAKTGLEERRLEIPQAWFPRVIFTRDNDFIVTSVVTPPHENAVIVWNRRTGEKVRQFPGFSFALSSDGKLIACGGRDLRGNQLGVIRVYGFSTGRMLREMSGHLTQVVSLSFSWDGRSLVSVGLTLQGLRTGEPGEMETKFTRVWDVSTGKEIRALRSGKETSTVLHSPDGRTVASIHKSGGDEILLWEAATGENRARLGQDKGVWGIDFSPDGRTLASAGGDGTVRLWDLPSCKEVGRLECHQGYVWAVAFSPDGRTLVSGAQDKTARIWDVSQITGRNREQTQRLPADLATDWKDLAGDAATGYAALARLLLSSPEGSVAFLGKQLESAKLPDPKRIAQLIAGLDDDQFRVREEAAKELESLSELAAPALRKALAGEPSAEARRRLETLVSRLDCLPHSTEVVRRMRAVEALEAIGDSQARRLLDKFAAGPAEWRLTEEAKSASLRLAKRAAASP